MGNIAKRRTAPTVVTQTIPTTPAIATTASLSTGDTSSVGSDIDTQTDEEVASVARSQSLLSRSRGRLGTVLTSFRGFLSDQSDDIETQRKTLLGE